MRLFPAAVLDDLLRAGGRGREVGSLISSGGGCGAEVLVLDGCVRAAAASDPPCSNRKARKQEIKDVLILHAVLALIKQC